MGLGQQKFNQGGFPANDAKFNAPTAPNFKGGNQM